MEPMLLNPMMAAWASGCSKPVLVPRRDQGEHGYVPTYKSKPAPWQVVVVAMLLAPELASVHDTVLHPVTHVHWVVVELRESARLRVQIACAIQDPLHDDTNQGAQLGRKLSESKHLRIDPGAI